MGRKIDLAAIGAGGTIASIGSLLLIAIARSTFDASSAKGPTAATLDDAFHDWIAAGVGVSIGCAAATALSRKGRPILIGVITGAFACLVVLIPALIITLPDDVSSREMPGIAVLATVLLVPFVLAGTFVGTILRFVRSNPHDP